MALKLILLALPALILAKMDLKINGTVKKGILYLNVDCESKSDESIITQTERNTFNLTDNNLKNAVESIFGKRPQNVYLTALTPWGNLFDKYYGKEVTRILTVNSVKIFKTSSNSVLISQQFFENYISKPITANVAISEEVQNTVSSFWSSKVKLSIGNNTYEIKFEIDSGKEIFFNFSSSWNEDIEQTQTVTIKENNSTKKILEPGQSSVADLYATKHIIRLKIEYKAVLVGNVAIYYSNPYKNDHFWIISLSACMLEAQLSENKILREFVDIVFYTDPKLIIVDSIKLI